MRKPLTDESSEKQPLNTDAGDGAGHASTDPGGVIICRCEEVTLADIEESIEHGASSLAEIRRLTRAGMGLCQGRTCHLHVRSIAQRHGFSGEQLLPPTSRSPVRPLKIRSLADSYEEEHVE